MTPEDSKRLDEFNRKLDRIEPKLDLIMPKLDRLLAILDGPEEGENEALYLHCLKEFIKGNRAPLEAYGKRGGKIPKHFSLRPEGSLKARGKATGNQPDSSSAAE